MPCRQGRLYAVAQQALHVSAFILLNPKQLVLTFAIDLSTLVLLTWTTIWVTKVVLKSFTLLPTPAVTSRPLSPGNKKKILYRIDMQVQS